jgi:hypothetical protein
MFHAAKPQHAEFTASLKNFRDSSTNWFDGTVRSVDQRLGRCARLLGAANAAAGLHPISESGQFIAAIQELSADRQALAGLREDLLTGGSGRENVGVSRAPGRTATAARAALTPAERRWVDLESVRFVQANRDAAHAPDELAIRAQNHAELHASRLGRRCIDVTAAFVDSVLAQGRQVPRPKVASAPKTMTDFPDDLLFLA